MTIEAKVRPHVEMAVRDIENANDDGEIWYAVFTLAAKLKYHAEGRDIDRLSRKETDELIFHWLDGNDAREADRYVNLAIDYIIEVIEE